MVKKTFLIEKQFRSTRKTLDDETEEMIEYTKNIGIETVFSRQEKYDESFIGFEKSRCYFGSNGICCRQCAMGPCRIWDDELPSPYKLTTPQLDKGTCGANVDTIVARNLLMMVGRGTAAHSSHARHIASTLLKTTGKNKIYGEKLKSIAKKLNMDEENLDKIAISTASVGISDILSDKNFNQFAKSYLPIKDPNIMPGSIGHELLTEGHETSMGTMTDPVSLIIHAARLGIADISSLIISSEFQDVLFGIPKPCQSKIGFNVLSRDKINVVVHGHVPLLSEKIIELSEDNEIQTKVKSTGASGINIVGCCCTGNEILMRHGIPLAGSNLQQELIIATGLVEAFVVDTQCIYPNIENVATRFHTKIITTMKEARLPNAEHIEFDEEHVDQVARKILETAIDNFNKRGKNIYLPKSEPRNLIAGFSVETCLNVLSKINPEDPLKPLIDNIASGNIYGVVLLAGCTSPKVTADASHVTIAKELIKNNILVIATGCAAQACARAGLLYPDYQNIGDKLKNILKILGETSGLGMLPPVWHFGSCVDNARVVILVSALADKLGIQIKDLPIAASAAEWVTEKAAAIGTGAMALGITVHLGVTPPVTGSPLVTTLLTQKSEEIFGGKFIVEIDPIKASQLIIERIKTARINLKLNA